MVENEQTPITSLNDFMEWILELGPEQYLFRGVPNECFDIGEASAYRRLESKDDRTIAKLLEINRNLLEDARRQGHDEINGSQLSDLELLGKLQHFRAATFLIDFTSSAEVALWFACEINSKEATNGKVAAVRNSPYKIKEVLSGDLCKEIDEFFKPDENENYPLYQWQPTSIDNRIIRQHSVFLFGGAKIVSDIECVILEEHKKEIRNALQKLSSTSANTLFPDFDGFVRQNAHDIVYNIPNYRGIAIQAHRKKDYSEAIANYDSAIRLEPKNSQLYFLRGSVKREMKEYKESIIDLSHSIEFNPSFSSAYYWRGRIHSILKQYEDSITDYNKAISISSEDASYYYSRGLAKYHLKQYRDAIEDFDKAIILDPVNENYYYWRAITKKKLGKSSGARRDFDIGLPLAIQTDNNEIISKIEEELSEIEDDDIPF